MCFGVGEPACRAARLSRRLFAAGNQIKLKRTEQPAGLHTGRVNRETISVPESERSDENGMVILSRVKGEGAKRLSHEHDGTACDCLCPAPFLYIKEGVNKKTDAPTSAEIETR